MSKFSAKFIFFVFVHVFFLRTVCIDPATPAVGVQQTQQTQKQPVVTQPSQVVVSVTSPQSSASAQPGQPPVAVVSTAQPGVQGQPGQTPAATVSISQPPVQIQQGQVQTIAQPAQVVVSVTSSQANVTAQPAQASVAGAPASQQPVQAQQGQMPAATVSISQQPAQVQSQPVQSAPSASSEQKTITITQAAQASAPAQSPVEVVRKPHVLHHEPRVEKKKLDKKTAHEDTIDFTFDNIELSQMIRRYAQKKGVNVILPPIGLQEKVTFRPARPLTLAEARKYLYLFLDYAGYTVLPGRDFVVAAKSKDALRSQLPFYVFESDGKIKPDILSTGDEFVRAIFYFTNLKVDTSDNSVTLILREVLSSPDNFFVDPVLNGVIITDKSRIVRAALQLLQELDSKNPDYTITTLQLYNASAGSISKLLMEQILSQPARFADSKTTISGTYFSTTIRVVADIRRNMLIIMGKEAAVNRLKNFIRDSLDAAPETGKTIFHVYDLRYLDAETFAGVLENIIKSSSPGDQVSQDRAAGVSRSFEGVSVKAEVYKADQATTQSSVPSGFDTSRGSTGTIYRGGNRLLIAAQPSDWIQIKKLIEQLDVPQRQVIIEVLIVDYGRDKSKSVSSQMRNPQRLDLPDGVQFQTAHLANNAGILPSQDCSSGCPLGTNIIGDLLRVLPGSTPTIASGLLPGTSVISLADPDNSGIWGVWAVLNQTGNVKVLSHPHLIALNNTSAYISNTEIKRADGAVSTSSGSYNVAKEDIPASLKVTVTPRIASAERLNLDIVVDISQFTTGFERNTRLIQTNVNMNGKDQILVLGGLTKTNETDLGSTIPIIGQIPLIGWLFKGCGRLKTETELGIFIRPVIIEPKLRETANEYTKTEIERGIDRSIHSGADFLGENSRDPVIRLFFGEPTSGHDAVKDYLTVTRHEEMIK